MKQSIKTGFSFGLTSGIITTLGLMVGLNSSTHSRLVVIGGILTIAIADAFSDAFGIHFSEESENKHNTTEIWQSAISTFFSKLAIALTFIVPLLLLQFSIAIIVSVIWGLSVLAIFSFYVAKERRARPWWVITEHLIIASVVIVITHYVGDWIGSTFA